MKDANSFISPLGSDFIVNFGCSKDANVMKEMRRIYMHYKQRDAMLDDKKSIFYSFMYKVITNMF